MNWEVVAMAFIIGMGFGGFLMFWVIVATDSGLRERVLGPERKSVWDNIEDK